MIKKISSRVVYKNKWMEVHEDAVEFPDGSEGIYGVIRKADAALIIPKIGDEYIMVKPWRYTIQEAHWEFPCGGVEEKELDPESIARQELQEETGYTAGKMTLIGSHHTSYGLSSQVMHKFLAEDLRPGSPKHDSGEIGMDIKKFSVVEISSMIRNGEITDSHTIAAWGVLGLIA